MKFALFALCAIAATMAHESVTLDDSTDLIQESAMIDTGIATHAKVGAKMADAAKTKAGSQVKARATVMIGTHELDAEEVDMAKSNLKKLTMKLGARHPVFLGESASIADFTKTGSEARYVKGGYAKLSTILTKVDEFHNEIKVEKQTAVDEREKLYNDCEQNDANFAATAAGRTTDKGNLDTLQNSRYTQIAENRKTIEADLSKETTLSQEIESDTGVVDTKYREYWTATEDRHQVRNVLMQALWLVCTGFRSFRHSEYCTNIRQQPDFDEPSTGVISEADLSSGDGPAEKEKLVSRSTTFGQTMQPVWEQQKTADAATVNNLDGDVDMEKGFVNNKAPWGVDPAGAQEEELGESNESEDMSSDEMSSRLNFLLESSSVPERISSPITAFIQALDTNDVAVQQSLVAALVGMDTAEGQSQSNIDYTWYQTVIAKRKTMYEKMEEALALKTKQKTTFEDIERLQDLMADTQSAEVAATKQNDAATRVHQDEVLECDENIIEKEALIEICNEELTNIQRLNSLLRFLVVGDKPKCAGNGFECNNAEEGSCTWRNRGQGKSGESAKDCETETGADIPCDYSGSQFAETADNTAEFCACEYGFFGSNEKDLDCKLKTCPGYGRIRYNKNQQESLQFYNVALHLSTGAKSAHDVLAVCSGIRKEEHGTCDVTTGQCSSCYVAAGDPKKVTPALNDAQGVKSVPNTVIESMPYSGAEGKCEEWYVPRSKVGSDVVWTTFTDTQKCSGKGAAAINVAAIKPGVPVYHTGKCVCVADRYGQACELTMMEMGEGEFYPSASPVVCSGRGVANNLVAPATCECNGQATGRKCEEIRCPGFDSSLHSNGVIPGSPQDPECGLGLGSCNLNNGRCACTGGSSCGLPNEAECPGACLYEDCANNCGGDNTDGSSQTGLCNRFTGQCSCNFNNVFNGPTCIKPERGAQNKMGAEQHETMIWTASMDKWGWSLCKDGHLLTGMKTDLQQTKDALYNLDSASCAQPYEASGVITKAVEPSRCYHENWWKKFDTRGGKFCRRNYFVAGLFRSHCNSLYCIEMAKCCSVKRSIWTNCKWTATGQWTNRESGMKVADSTSFIVGFFRGATHTLDGITSIRECTPIWYGQLYKFKSRFD